MKSKIDDAKNGPEPAKKKPMIDETVHPKKMS